MDIDGHVVSVAVVPIVKYKIRLSERTRDLRRYPSRNIYISRDLSKGNFADGIRNEPSRCRLAIDDSLRFVSRYREVLSAG